MSENSIKEQTISSAKWSAFEKIGLQGIQFVIGIIMARLLVPADYGIIGILSIFLGISTTFVDSGFGNAIIRKLDRSEKDFSTVFYFNFFAAIVIYSILFITAPLISSFFHIPILKAVIRVQCINIIIDALMQIQVAKLTIDLNFRALAIRSLMSSIISGIFGIILALNNYGVWSLVYQAILYQVINLLFICYTCRWTPSLTFSWKSFNELGSYGVKIFLSNLINRIYQEMNTIVIGRFFSSKDLGYYNRGTQFARLPSDTINGILGKILFPIFVNLQNDDKRLVEVYRKYVQVLSIPISFGCILIAVLAKPLIILILTDKWSDSIIYLQIFAFAVIFDPITYINLVLLQVKGRSDLYLKVEIIKKIVSIIILFSAIPFGVIGICVSKIIYTQFAIVANTYYTGKLFNLGYWTQVKDFSIYLIYAALACLPALILAYTPFNSFISINANIIYILQLTLGIMVSSFLYYLFLKRNPCFKELIQIVLKR